MRGRAVQFSTKLILVLISNSVVFADLLVQLPNGLIRGRTVTTIKNTTYYAFQQIPYASPPVEHLRFQPPIPQQNWDGILNTTDNDKICYNINANYVSENEDCLYVNVYTSKLTTNDENEPTSDTIEDLLPVMVFIHGGGFIQGFCGLNACGPEFLLERDVVVVTVLYRLGAFGFLSTQDSVIPGNYGLKDQHLAIKWVHSNVGLFGGDPDKITIFGQSAGAASVAYQLLNKISESLFRGAICESASFLTPSTLQRNARYYAFKTASFLNETFSDSDDSVALLDYLRTVPASEIKKASEQVVATESIGNLQIVQGFYYAPVIETEHDDAFITERMYVSLRQGDIVKVPLLIGINSEESISYADFLQTVLPEFDDNLEWLVPNDMRIDNLTDCNTMGRMIKDIYVQNNDLLQNNLGSSVRGYLQSVLSNIYVKVCQVTWCSSSNVIIKHAELQSQLTNVYFYQFSYDGIIGNVSIHVDGAESVAHSEEVRYIFQMVGPLYDNSDLSVFPPSDVVTQQRVQTLWTNFAKFLDPTPVPLEILQNIAWPTVNSGSETDFLYLDINENLAIRNYPKNETYKAWTELYDSLGYDDFDTY